MTMCERLQTPDPFNPGCGPTRYLPPIKEAEDFTLIEERKKKIARTNEQIKREMVEASIKTKKMLHDSYNQHCRGIREYVRQVKLRGIEKTASSPYHTDNLKLYESELAEKRRRMQLMKRKMLQKNIGSVSRESLLSAEAVEKEKENKYRLALRLNLLAQELSTTYESELELRSYIQLECQHAEKNFPFLAMHFSKQQEGGLDSMSSSLWRPSSRARWRGQIPARRPHGGPETKEQGVAAEDSLDHFENLKIGSKAFSNKL